MKKICFITAIPITAHAFLKDHMEALSDRYKVYYVCSEPDEEKILVKHDGYHCVEIQRGISLIKDVKSIIELIKFFKKEKFDAVHSVTPKAGLVTAIAGAMSKVPVRIHIFTGQVWATRKGIMRWVLKSVDKLIAHIDTHILVDGKSQRAFLIEEGVLKDGQAEVFGKGSISGVNSNRFVPDIEARTRYRRELGIKEDAICYIYLGRLNHDKGIDNLYEAFNRLANECSDVFLLLVGTDEEGYASKIADYKNLVEGENFHFYGRTKEPEKILNAGDVFTLPTYREGFGTSVLEAASVGLPCICSDAYGVLDAYVENETGLRCRVGDSESLYQCMRIMHNHRDMVKQMGDKSRERVLNDFNGSLLTKYWLDFYKSILA